MRTLTIEEVKKIMQPGHDAVLVKGNGGFTLYGGPRKLGHPHEEHLLRCHHAGAKVLHGENAVLFSSFD